MLSLLLLNVTIAYPKGARNLWDFFCGGIQEIKVKVESFPINKELVGDYFNDMEFREKFNDWLNNLWDEKDKVLESMINEPIPEETAEIG